MSINTVLVVVLGVICYFVLPFLIWACVKKEKIRNILTISFFCLYLVVLFIGVFGQLDIGNDLVTFSFDFGGKWCAKKIGFGLTNISKFDLVINLVMLFPVGMLVYYFAKRKKWWVKILLLLGFGLLTGLLIETLQFILPVPRSVQLSDALLNMASTFVGGLIAWGYLWFIDKFIDKKNKNSY